jgi:hypothetical protein
MIDLVQTKVRHHFLNVKKSFVKKLRPFIWGRSLCKRGSPDLPEFAAWRRQIFVRVAGLILYLQLLKILWIFLFQIEAARIKLCQCSYFMVAKNPRDYICLGCPAGRCEQRPMHKLRGQSMSVH